MSASAALPSIRAPAKDSPDRSACSWSGVSGFIVLARTTDTPGTESARSTSAPSARTACAPAADRAEVRAGSVLGLGPAPRALDLLLFDAPYGTGAGSVALDKLTRLGWVGPESWVSVETADKEVVEVAGFEVDTERKVGKARLTLLRRAT